ncbi:MAG: IS3 family transposase, partial [Campylobacterales bacterium]|nr:IS3 family transposase [Campylobacterales bacterium]
IYLNEYESVSKLKEDVKDYIEFYNNKRFHESLDYKKPMEVYFNSMKINEQNKLSQFNENYTFKVQSVA